MDTMNMLDLKDVGTTLYANEADSAISAIIKISNGANVNAANLGNFSHQAFLRLERPGADPSYCGASIIHPLLLLTAAHCFLDGVNASGIKPMAGDINCRRMIVDGAGQHLEVHSFIIHPDYNRTDQDSDIAIVTLKAPLKFNNVTQPIKIPEPDQQLPSDYATVSGWGGDMNSKNLQYDLQYADVDLADRESCKKTWGDSKFKKAVTDNMICAGGGLTDACRGDSGGPLTCKDKETGENFLCGIVSFGVTCTISKEVFPGLYTDVRKFHGWIRKHMQIWWRYYYNMEYGQPLEDLDGNVACAQGYFQCETIKACIPESFRCDGEDDCAPWDKSEEEGCTEIKCAEGRFLCRNGTQCVPQTYRCDRENDCVDKSDEGEAECHVARA